MTDQTPELRAGDAHRILRLNAFLSGCQTMAGPLGELLREFAHAYNEYAAANQSGFTTEAEDVRMAGLLEANLECWEWLKAGEQS